MVGRLILDQVVEVRVLEREQMKALLTFPIRGKQHISLWEKKTFPELRGMYPWEDVAVFDSLHEPFNRAATRNLAVQYALENEIDVVVICDADSIPQRHVLVAAIEGAYSDGRLHIPFTTVRVIQPKWACADGQRYRQARPYYTYGPSCGGVFVIRPDRWVHIGGMDERVTGWGYEDQIMLVVARTFLGGPVYHDGVLYNFNHDRVVEISSEETNTQLRDAYNMNLGDRDAILRLQAGSNRWRP